MAYGRDPRADAGDLYRIGNDDSKAHESPLRYPECHEDWVARYSWLFSAYVGEPYEVSDIQSLGLFRALDEDGKVIAETKRLTRDIQFVVDQDAQALAGELMLDLDYSSEGETDPALEADFEIARDIWNRSEIEVEGLRWATMCASMGDVMVEAVRQNPTPPYNVAVVAYDPRHVYLVKDEVTGRTLQEASVTIPYFDPPTVSATGVVTESSKLHTYRRVLDDKEVTVYRDGKYEEDESGSHDAGVVPLVHLPFRAYVEPEHGLWAALGLEPSLALIDSLMTQLQAIGNRYANPMLAVKGAKIAADSDASKFGRILSGIPPEGDVSYLEANLSAISTLLDAAITEHDSVRATLPEFLFTESGANASGDALNFRATAFEAKMRAVRNRWYAGLARIMEIAVAMEKGEAYDETKRWLKVSGGPILPVNVSKELETISKAYADGGLLDRDYVAHLQRLKIAPPAEDPDAYVEAVIAEHEVKRTLEGDALNRLKLFGAMDGAPEGIDIGGLPEPRQDVDDDVTE